MTPLFMRSDDQITTTLSVDDKALLVQIPDLLDSVGVSDADPAVPILNRAAHTDDSAASDEFEHLIASQRASDRAADIAALDSILRGSTTLSLEEAESLLRVLNRARLTLAARTGVFESGAGWEARVSEDPSLAALAWLGYVQSELLSALMDPSTSGW